MLALTEEGGRRWEAYLIPTNSKPFPAMNSSSLKYKHPLKSSLLGMVGWSAIPGTGLVSR